jgi:membrane protein
MIKIVRIITQTPGISHAIAFSKKAKLPGFEGVPLYDVIRFFFKETQKVSLNERAAAISHLIFISTSYWQFLQPVFFYFHWCRSFLLLNLLIKRL